ncbi:MAG: trimethylamine methyltransferase family protein [Anaerolineae bacterium]
MRIPYQHQPTTDFLDDAKLQRIHQTALRLLQEVGLEVSHEGALTQMASAGFRVGGNRVYFEPHVVEEYLVERRRRLEAERAAEPPQPPATDDFKLHLSVGVYAHHVHDLDGDRIVPYTCDSLTEMTKLVDVLEERNLHAPAPGYPLDVAPALQPIAKYRIGALYSRHGEWPVDPISEESIPYIFEIADALGHAVRSLPVYVFSPLRLAGESLGVIMKYRHLLDRVHVGAMPSVGATVPIMPFGALATSVAEVVGGFVALSVITGLPVDFGIGLHAFDLRFGTMVFGSPEAYLFGQLGPEVNEFYDSGRRRRRRLGLASGGTHSRANFPNAQAAAEKASIMTTGALIGVRWFDGIGILSVDEVFSAEQVLIDCEIKDQVERLIGGLDMSGEGYDWVEEVRQGVQGSFVSTDSTLDGYRETYWHPELFDRGFLAAYGYDGRMKLAERAHAMVRRYVARHEFEPGDAVRRAVDRVWEKAVRELG